MNDRRLTLVRVVLLVWLSTAVMACVAAPPMLPVDTVELNIEETEEFVEEPLDNTEQHSADTGAPATTVSTPTPEENSGVDAAQGETVALQSTFTDGTPTDISCFGGKIHSEAERIAEEYSAHPEKIMGWFCANFGFGDIRRGLRMQAETERTLVEILPMLREGMDWEEIRIEVGASPETLAD